MEYFSTSKYYHYSEQMNQRSVEIEFIHSVTKQFEYYKSIGEKSFNQLSENDLFWKFDTQSNSIAIIVNHLSGNMKSRWTNFLTTDGEKDWRNRDREFQTVITNKKDVLDTWADGWNCLFQALNNITKENFETKIYIRNQEHSILEAVHRQLAHYSYHIGQIIYITKMIKGNEWKSLTIPLGESTSFNNKKFSKGKHQGHFSDDL